MTFAAHARRLPRLRRKNKEPVSFLSRAGSNRCKKSSAVTNSISPAHRNRTDVNQLVKKILFPLRQWCQKLIERKLSTENNVFKIRTEDWCFGFLDTTTIEKWLCRSNPRGRMRWKLFNTSLNQLKCSLFQKEKRKTKPEGVAENIVIFKMGFKRNQKEKN